MLMVLLIVAVALPVYAYVAYPLMLVLAARALPRRRAPSRSGPEWPLVSITLPVYNEEAVIRARIENLLALDYPADRRQILVISDASDDGTDAIVSEFAHHDVELLRLPVRRGKTAAENLSRQHVRGEIVFNTDASVSLHPGALKAMVAAFDDPTVGVASCRVVSVGRNGESANSGDADYVGYDMWVRRGESRVWGAVGASGCFFAMRAELHEVATIPESLSCDFAAALIASERGYRTVLVEDALCYVPRAPSLGQEYRRKVRTMTRGMATLLYMRHLMNPFVYGRFAWILVSHKLVRWLVPWAGVVGMVVLAALSTTEVWARVMLSGGLLVLLVGGAGFVLARSRKLPALLSLPAYLVGANVAAIHAAVRVFRGRHDPTWEPTRRRRTTPSLEEPVPRTN